MEGFLICPDCKSTFPIISGIAVIVKDIIQYASQRSGTFGKWYSTCKSDKMKSYLKDLSTRLVRNSVIENRYEDDGRYFQTYKWLHNDNFESDKFLHLLRWKIKPSDVYRKLTSGIKFEPEGIALDLGCALGLSTLELANKFSFVFGIDSSFSFMVEAKKKSSDAGYTNIEFFVCDILDLPFKSNKFDLIFGLNIVEFVTTTPYDYNREVVYNPNLDDHTLRIAIENNGFEITIKTRKESFIPWILKINERTYLFYFLDLIEARKISKHKH
jgi:2-polyprenyl-3-methyl-5-hydroxy-6-metoxy-1,4-benzoquinol methylase